MRILITGGNGYVARGLQEGLKASHSITCVSRQDFDLTNYEQTVRWFGDKYFDAIIHTAVVGGMRLAADDDSVISQNLQMYYNLTTLEGQFGRFITFGSGAELTIPWKPYGLSKRIIAESMRNRKSYYNLRIRAVFSENELSTRFIKSNLLRYINREPMVIHQNKCMDFFYMEDLVSLVDYYIKAENPAQDVNCCYNNSFTLLEIANFINTLEDYKVDIKIQTDGMGSAYVGDYTPLPYPTIGLTEGIRSSYSKLKV